MYVHFCSLKSYSCLSSGYFYRLHITFANSLDPDQDPQNVFHDLDPNCLTISKVSKDNKSMKN